MSDQQRYAIENYCLLGFEVSDPRFHRQHGSTRVGLSVNAGWE